MRDLRDELEIIVNGGRYFIAEQPAAVAELFSKIPHSIRHVVEQSAQPYNCFMYALRLLDHERVYAILQDDANRNGWADIKVGPKFVARLIDRGILVEDVEGEIVIYFRGNIPVHAGINDKGRITSKWGIGNLWVHEMWEAPRSYGDRTVRHRITHPELIDTEFEAHYAELLAAKEDALG